MVTCKKIKVGKKSIFAFSIPLQDKKLILLRGERGYIMCGYLNLKVAQKFNDVAIKIVGVSTIEDALKSQVHSLTNAARRLGLHKDQPIRDVLGIIA